MWTGTAQLQNSIAASDTQLKVQGQLAQLAAGDVVQVEKERMVILSVGGSSTYNVQRGTAAAAHSAGVPVYQTPNPTNQLELNLPWCGPDSGWQVIGGVWTKPLTVA